jgi:putative CocE/NonD family hydrolase
MGADEWREAEAWPPAEAKACALYFHSSGRAARNLEDGRLSLELPGEEPPDIYMHDPGEPVPSIGGSSCCRPDLAPVGVFDQRRAESRTDVLTYTTAEFAEDSDIVGPVEVVLHAATDAVDTDWTAKLVDVHPDGRALNICDGIIRARFRESIEIPRLLTPGEVCRYRISLGATAMRIKAGHRLRLEIASSNFPNYDVNPNTGESAWRHSALDAVIATQLVYHDGARPSHLILMLRGGAPVLAGA